MNVKRCENGHFYDIDRYEKCPLCFSDDELLNVPEKFRRLGILSRLDRGSTCRVYKIESESPLVLKVINCGSDKNKYNSFLYEKHIADILRQSDRAMPIQNFDVVESPNGETTVYILEKYYVSLERFLSTSICSVKDLLKVAIDLCDAVQDVIAHGVFHLDLKPKNIFISDENKVILGDFGSAMLADDLANNQSVRGTPEYMAPEVYQDYRCTELSEIYSIGLIIYYLLNDRKLPFVEEQNDSKQRELATYKRLAGAKLPIISINTRIDDEINSIIKDACSYKPKNRTQSVSDLKSRLVDVLPLIDEHLMTVEPIAISDSVNTSLSQSAQENTLSPKDLWSEELWKADPIATTMALQFTARTNDIFSETNHYGQGSNSFEETLAPSEMPAEGVPNRCRVCDNALLPGAAFCSCCGTKATIEKPIVQISEVDFSAVAPKKLIKGEYSIIDIVMYEESCRHIVNEIHRQSDSETQEKKSGKIKVQEDANIKVVLSSNNIEIEDNEMTGVWQGSYLSFSFPIYLPKNYKKKQVLFVAKVFINEIIATKLSFVVRRSSFFEKKISVKRSDVSKAFISYASQDRKQVAMILQGMQRARPEMNFFFDVESLRAGDDWEEKLYKEIDERDVLYLCWSRHAKDSVWVDREWRHAFSQKGIDGIEPMPIELPEECPPPQELSKKHWNDRLLYLIDYLNKDSSKEQT